MSSVSKQCYSALCPPRDTVHVKKWPESYALVIAEFEQRSQVCPKIPEYCEERFLIAGFTPSCFGSMLESHFRTLV